MGQLNGRSAEIEETNVTTRDIRTAKEELLSSFRNLKRRFMQEPLLER